MSVEYEVMFDGVNPGTQSTGSEAIKTRTANNIKGKTESKADIVQTQSKVEKKRKEYIEAEQKKISEKESELKQEDVYKEKVKKVDDDIKNRLNGLRNIIDTRPCFLKPAYLLQNSTPHVSATLTFIGGGEDEDLMTYDFLPPSEAGKYNNIIKNFEFDVTASSVKLTITDADEDLIEYFAFMFANLLLVNPPILEIEYGWADNSKDGSRNVTNYIEDFRNASDSLVYFRRKIFCHVNDFEHSYSTEGVLELTFLGSYGTSFPQPFQHFLPYHYMGSTPGITLQLLHVLFVYKNLLNSFVYTNNVRVVLDDFLYPLAHFLILEKDIIDVDSIIEFIKATLKMFRTDLYTNIIGPNNTLMVILRKDLETFVKSVESNGNINQTYFNKIYNLISNPKPEIVTENKSILDNLNSMKKIFEDKSYYKKFKILRDFLKDNTSKFSKELREYISTITPILTEATIHPFDVLRYISGIFEEQFYELTKKSTDSAVSNSEFVVMQGFENGHIGGYYIELKDKKDEYEDEAQFQKKYERSTKPFLVKAGSISLLATSSWDDLFSMLADKCRVWINKSDWERLNKQVGGVIEKFEEEERKKKNLQDVNPTQMTGRCFALKRTDALFNLETFKLILEARSKDFQNCEDQIKTLKENIELVNKMSNDGWVILVSLDVVPGIEQLFDPINGKNQILQAYSYRAGNILAFSDEEGNNFTQYNPGYPSVWHINFPDVISFQPKFNLKNQIDNVANVMKQKVANFKDEIDKKEVELTELRGATYKEKDKQENNKLEISEKEKEIKTLQQQKQYFELYHDDVPYTDPSMMIFDEPLIQVSTLADVQEKRKVMQEFRKHALVAAVNIEAELEVLGDPIFDIHTGGKYLFLKYMTQMGNLSYFTGIYSIMNIKHIINPGEFKTSFTLQKDATAGSSEFAEQMKSAIVLNDNGYS